MAPPLRRMLLPLWALLLAVALPGASAQADEAWRARLEAELLKVEKGVGGLDGKTATEGTLVARVKAAHERLCALETAATIKAGAISGKDDLGALTQDIIALKGRVAALELDRSPPPKKPAGAGGAEKPKEAQKPKEPVPPKEPKKPTWPESLDWKATASLVYTESGQWYGPDPARGIYDNQFRQTGYEGTLSFTIRASGLKSPIQSATLRVAVSLGEPWTRSTKHEVYEVEWNAQSAFHNDALRTWRNHGTLTADITPRWLLRTTKTTESPKVRAHVLKVVTKDGETIQFSAPEYGGG